MKGSNAPLQRLTLWRGLLALALLLTLTNCRAPQISAPQRSAPLNANRTALRLPQTGTCECPYDLNNAGKQCGNSSSYSRGGGNRPACYVGENSQTAQVPSTGSRPTPAPSSNPHLLVGNPSGAATNPNNYLMEKPQYALSYNRDKGTANWVSWQSNKSWIGSVDRSNDFRFDPSLPDGFYVVTPKDYTGTGYDRGHIVPSGDRTNSKADNSATFLMTNMMPQVGALNREVWREFEEYCRQLVSQGKELYVIAGPFGKNGTIASGNVTIPSHNWKVVLVLDKSGSGLNGVTVQTQTIAVWMPNDASISNTDWKRYIVSVDDVEAKTGYDFFSNVPATVQKVIESKRYSP